MTPPGVSTIAAYMEPVIILLRSRAARVTPESPFLQAKTKTNEGTGMIYRSTLVEICQQSRNLCAESARELQPGVIRRSTGGLEDEVSVILPGDLAGQRPHLRILAGEAEYIAGDG
jgi:hypothetical protein